MKKYYNKQSWSRLIPLQKGTFGIYALLPVRSAGPPRTGLFTKTMNATLPNHAFAFEINDAAACCLKAKQFMQHTFTTRDTVSLRV